MGFREARNFFIDRRQIPIPGERMNSPLEKREVRLRGLWGRDPRVSADVGVAAGAMNRALRGRNG
jgi:hypothetical protein